MAYTEKVHHLFLKNVNTKDYDGFIFGEMDTGTHFFTVVLFLDKKEVFIFDPLQFDSTILAVTKFLKLLLRYSNWLDSGDGQPAFSKDYTFTEVEQKTGLYLMSRVVTNLCPMKVMGKAVAWI